MNQSVDLARAEAIQTLSVATTLTDEEKSNSYDALDIIPVPYSSSALNTVLTDLTNRQASSDPVLQGVVSISIELERNVVVVGAPEPSEALRTAMTDSYGNRVVVEQRLPSEDAGADGAADVKVYGAGGPYNSTKNYGGKAIRGTRYCSSAFPMISKTAGSLETYLLTAGHCTNDNVEVYNARCDRAATRDLIGTTKKSVNTAGTMDAAIVTTTMYRRMYTGAGWARENRALQSQEKWYEAFPAESASCDEQNAGSQPNPYPTCAGYESLNVGYISKNQTPPTSVCKWGVVTGFYCDYKRTGKTGANTPDWWAYVYDGKFDRSKAPEVNKLFV